MWAWLIVFGMFAAVVGVLDMIVWLLRQCCPPRKRTGLELLHFIKCPYCGAGPKVLYGGFGAKGQGKGLDNVLPTAIVFQCGTKWYSDHGWQKLCGPVDGP